MRPLGQRRQDCIYEVTRVALKPLLLGEGYLVRPRRLRERRPGTRRSRLRLNLRGVHAVAGAHDGDQQRHPRLELHVPIVLLQVDFRDRAVHR